MTLDEKGLTDAQSLFKGLNLSQPQAQSLIDFHANAVASAGQASLDAVATMQESWKAQIKADPEIGPKTQQVRETISRALDGLGDAKLAKDFRETMDLTGIGDNPAFIKVFHRFAQQVTEGKGVNAGGPSTAGQRAPNSGPPTAAKALYPNLP